MLEAPGFHHLHLNSVDPEAAVEFYAKRFATTSKTTWAGKPALLSPNNVLLLFDKVETPPATSPQTAFWHFGWYVLDTHAALERFKDQGDVALLPLFTGEDSASVYVSSDTWPGAGGLLGRTLEQIAEAKATGVEPIRQGGFGYFQGPDDAIVEYIGNHPAERFNHVHLFQEDPFCAQLWYLEHLNAPLFRDRGISVTEDTCQVPRGADRTFPALKLEGMYRTPSAAVEFGDVAFMWYMRQGSTPLVGTRGHLVDHVGLSVSDLDVWLTKLRGEGVRILAEPYRVDETRALMIEGPSLEAIELVEVGDGS